MAKRPLPITVVGWLFVLVGCGSLGGHLWKHFAESGGTAADPREGVDLAWAAASAIVALAGGTLLLRGLGWARWLLAAWMGGHVVLGMMHSKEELLVHLLFFAPLVYLLFRPRSAVYFRAGEPGGP